MILLIFIILINNFLVDSKGNSFPIVNGVPRITSTSNYTDNFGMQWNKFDKTQLDYNRNNLNLSYDRFFKQTEWSINNLKMF